MEAELDPSTIGQSFEKVGDTISKAQMEELETVGPLDQNNGRAPEEWLRQGAAHSSTSTITIFECSSHSHVGCSGIICAENRGFDRHMTVGGPRMAILCACCASTRLW